MYTQAEWTQQFLQHLQHERRLSQQTVKSYQRDLTCVQAYCHDRKLSEWTQLDVHVVRALVAHLHRQGLHGRSIARLLSALRSLFRFLLREEHVAHNPAEGVSAPKTERPLPKVLDVDQMSRLLDIKDTKPLSLRDRALMELMYSSGLRLSELVNLDVNDLDQRDALVTVTGKGNKSRVLPVGRMALQAIQV